MVDINNNKMTEEPKEIMDVKFSEDDNEIDLSQEVPVPNAPDFEIPHPMLMQYNYIIDLESRILQLEDGLNQLITYFQQKEQKGDKK